MRRAKGVSVFLSSLIVMLGLSVTALANKSSVEIEAPESAEKGSEITIRVNVSHSGNSRMHYTDWVYIKVNGKEVARWDFSGTELPESERFSRETKYRVEGDIEITAQANCNVHGSKGLASGKVKAEQPRKEEAK